jgi:hypothetical protein
MPNIYSCHANNKGPGILRAVLELRSAQYVGPRFPTMSENSKADFGVLRVSEAESHRECQVGFYYFDTDIMALEEAIQACTEKLPAIGTKPVESHAAITRPLGPTLSARRFVLETEVWLWRWELIRTELYFEPTSSTVDALRAKPRATEVN